MTHHRSQAHTDTPGARFLDPKVLARIDNLDLLARTVVDGFLHGLHKSPYMGLSMEFAEHRPYMPGDDIRKIDWRLFARTDRHYVKQYEAETNVNFSVLLDVSRSMSYGSGSVTKLDYARFLAASLAYFSPPPARPRWALHVRLGGGRARTAIGTPPGSSAACSRARRARSPRSAGAILVHRGQHLPPPGHPRA